MARPKPSSRPPLAHEGGCERIFLIGFMGAGKSTVGRLLADRLGWRFLDLDERIEQRAGKPIREIFSNEGEEAFRTLEHESLSDLAGERSLVIAAGGGAPVQPRNRRFFLHPAYTIHLAVSLEEARKRTGPDPLRPLMRKNEAELKALYSSRLPRYRRYAAELSTDGKSPPQVVGEILKLLGVQ